MEETLSALEAWLDVLEAAGDDPDRLDAAADPARLASGTVPALWSPCELARANALRERMVALEVRLEARRAEVGRELAQINAASTAAPAAGPIYFDRPF